MSVWGAPKPVVAADEGDAAPSEFPTLGGAKEAFPSLGMAAQVRGSVARRALQLLRAGSRRAGAWRWRSWLTLRLARFVCGGCAGQGEQKEAEADHVAGGLQRQQRLGDAVAQHWIGVPRAGGPVGRR